MDATVKNFGLGHAGSSPTVTTKLNFNKRLLRFLPLIVGAFIVVTVATLLVLQIRSWLAEQSSRPKQNIQVISLIKPPPPPEVEKIPEQEIEQKIETSELEEAIPEMPENIPVSDLLGMDAEGGAGDAFGLQGRKGGRGLLDGDPFSWYKQIMTTVLTDTLNKIDSINKRSYSVDIKVWVSITGNIARFQIVRGTGNKEIDRAFIKGIPLNLSFGQQRPPGMEKTVTIRVVSRK